MSLLEYSKSYVPIYPVFVEITELHEKAHWGSWEVKLQSDVEDWKLGRVTAEEKYFLKNALRLFTQSDVAVGADYFDNLIPAIKNNEARNMLASFACREGTHMRAYALLNDTLGFGEGFYDEFLEYAELSEKIEFMLDMKNATPKLLATSMARQILCEGVSLFAMFAMLMNFSRFGKMLGMSDVIQWSSRDESIHVAGVSLLFRQLLKEHPEVVDDAFKRDIYDASRYVVRLEDMFIERAFAMGAVEGMNEADTKQYVRCVTDYRMNEMGFKSQWNVSNPFPWFDWVVSNSKLENFFESTTTDYSKDSMIGEYDTAYNAIAA